MLSYIPRSLLTVSLLLSAALCGLADAPASKPTPKQIAGWIEQLGDGSFTQREKASKMLWQAGAAAETALEKALKSDDPEVVRRARDLLDKFHWGIYPDTPADIVALIRAYQSSEGNARREVLQKLFESGDAGLRAVMKLARVEKDDTQRSVLRELLADKLPAAFLQAVMEEKYEIYEQLLKLGHEGQLISLNQYAAYWLLRSKLAERIAHFRAHSREHPDDKWSAATLVYLHRANGDLVEARKAAEKSERADLLEGILFELADWKALSARAEGIATEKPSDKDPFGVSGAENLASKWAYRAAYARLAGKQKDFEKAVRELRKLAESKEGRDKERISPAFVAAKGLLLNDRPVEGLDVLRNLPDRRVLLFDLLRARLQFSEALALADKEEPADKEIPRLQLARARLLCVLGEKEGKKLFDRYAEHIKDEVDPAWVQSLLKEEMSAGLKDYAFAHAARAMSVALPKNGKEAVKHALIDQTYLALLFPQQTKTAEVWWTLLRRQLEDKPPAAALKRLRQLLEGKLAAKDVKASIEEAEAWFSDSPPWPVTESAARLQALAETAALAGLDDLAVTLLKKAVKQLDSRDALLRLGDLLAAKKQWAKAAEYYQQAWNKELPPKTSHGNFTSLSQLPDPLPLYLAGDALVHAGREKAGKKLIEQSHWIPLADAATRLSFSRALGQRGHREAAERESDFLLRVSEPNTYQVAEAMHRRAIVAFAHKEYLKAAEGFEQAMLRCLHPYTYYLSNAAYATIPAQIHHLRARGLLAAGKLDEALKQADLALAASPVDLNLTIALVPELERRGHKKEAEALFERCHAAHEKVCRDYPRCAWAHNSAAWMSACCRRNLDKALQHAEKAIELEPKNASYIDTLAEVHFQRGDKDKAVALQKRAIELDPKKSYYRKQLKRLEAGDPSAERPPENDN
ncbi:MAG TPA: hypothetical protein VMG10_33525 [Gemmataceae bacterium]|nr:hypothetical protein [Gemmataceae bacterium]